MEEANTLADLLEPVPDYGDVFAFEDFLDRVKCGGFMDWDGSGYFGISTHIFSGQDICCNEQWLLKNKPPEATHIIWFNK